MVNQNELANPMYYDSNKNSWIINGINEARFVLESNKFKKIKHSEVNDDSLMSPSFFLPLEVTEDKEHPRLRYEFSKSFSNDRIKNITKEILEPIAKEKCSNLKSKDNEIDLLRDLLIPYCDDTILHLVGLINKEKSNELVSIYCLSEDYFKKEGKNSIKGKVAFKYLYEQLLEYLDNYTCNNRNKFSFINYMKSKNLLSNHEVAMYILPFLEMIVLKTHIELSVELIKNLQQLSKKDIDRFICSSDFADLVLEESVRLMSPNRTENPYISRIAVKDVLLNDKVIKKGERITLNIIQINLNNKVYECPFKFNPARKNLNKHLAFGAGIHKCLGKNLAKAIAEVVAKQLYLMYPSFKFNHLTNEIILGNTRV